MQKIKLTNDNKHIKAFRHIYEQHFAQFQDQMIEEYRQMKEGYILDFKNNFQINMNEKQANIDEFIETIEQKKRTA